MMRLLSAGAMGVMFLMISPPLRLKVETQLMLGLHTMDINAPYSYIGVGVLIVIAFLTSLVRGVRSS
jgi:hypothetical protein